MKKGGRFILLALILIFIPSWAFAYSPPPAGNIWILFQKPSLTYDLARGLIPTEFKVKLPNVEPKKVENFGSEAGSGVFDNPYNMTLNWTVEGNGDLLKYSFILTEQQSSAMLRDFEITLKFKPIAKSILEVLYNDTNNRCDKEGNQGDAGLYLCFFSNTTAIIPGQVRQAQYVQIVPYKGIFIEGNVAAGGTASNFMVEPDAIVAAGGSISTVDGGTQLSEYQVPSWPSSISVDKLISKAKQIGKKANHSIEHGQNSFKNLYLNTSLQNVYQSSDRDAFTSPPEGQLWHYGLTSIDKDNNKLTIYGVVSGSGTLVLDRGSNTGISVEIKNLTCEQNTRFALITNAPITIDATEGVGCGMYISKSGITFTGGAPGGVKVKGLFASEGSITLPNINQLPGPYEIYMDSYFADNPTVLTKELLNLTIGGR